MATNRAPRAPIAPIPILVPAPPNKQLEIFRLRRRGWSDLSIARRLGMRLVEVRKALGLYVDE